MKYPVEISSGAKCHIDWFSHSEVGKGDTQTHRQHEYRIGNGKAMSVTGRGGP
jgi:hypothetical protein